LGVSQVIEYDEDLGVEPFNDGTSQYKENMEEY